jgi:hypothetical protein
MDGAEQECSGYILSSASFLPGHLLFTQNRFAVHSHHGPAIPCADACEASRGLGIVTELVLGGRSMGFSP